MTRLPLQLAWVLYLGALNVFFRDVGQFTAFLLQFWFGLLPLFTRAPFCPTRLKRFIISIPSVVPAHYGVPEIFSCYGQWPDMAGRFWPINTTVYGPLLAGDEVYSQALWRKWWMNSNG